MAGEYLLGVDAGQTVTKAALFDLTGRELAVGSAGTRTLSRQPRWQERDMDEAWAQTAQAIRDCLGTAGVPGEAVLGVGLCGHNDGLHLVDSAGRPVRPAILATDSRAHRYAEQMRAGGKAEQLLARNGQVPVPYSPAPLLAWLRDNEPEALARTRYLLFCKDWLRSQMTGEFATDPSEASAFCTDIHTQTWSPAVLELYGLGSVAGILPPILDSAAVAGEVTPAAAGRTGLRAGTPVVTGAHDVDAAAVGIGAVAPGALSLVMGTFSINQVVAAEPAIDTRWQARTFVQPSRWLHMSTSPSSASNLDWVVRQFGPWDAGGAPDYGAAMAEAGAAAEGTPVYLPFLYGSPHGAGIGGAFAGLRGWHSRAEVLRAVLEGVVFNHRWHVSALAERFPVRARPARLCGGGARSPLWTQMLADALDTRIEVTDATEAGSRGAAVLAGVGAGAYPSLAAAVEATVRVVRGHEPRPATVAEKYERYEAVVAALTNVDL